MKKVAKKMTRPEWACPREDSFGETLAFDCGALSGESRAARARALAENIKPLKTARLNQILLLGLEGFPAADILAMLRAARKSGFEIVKLEMNLAGCRDTAALAGFLNEEADELFVVMPGRGDAISDEWRAALAALEEIARYARCAGRGGLRAIAKISGPAQAAAKSLKALAAAGAEHIIIIAEPALSPEESAKMAAACERSANQKGVTVELRTGDVTRVFRSPERRAREAESLFTEVPFYVNAGRPVALGAVFQLDFRCNQRCVFCSSDGSLPAPGAKVKKDLLKLALEQNPPRVVFTGGEPTLDKSLFEFIAMARRAGVSEISVYSNGMAFSSAEFTRRAAEAGMNLALVSLHSSRADVSDRITNCRGGFAKTAGGIDNLLNARIFTIINYVVNGLNYRETPEFARFAAERFPGAALNFSYVAPIMDETASEEIVPRFTDAVPFLVKALDECDAIGVNAAGLEPHWGVTPCALGKHRKRYFPFLPPLSGPYSGFVKPGACAGCALDAACPGVRRNYAKLYGTGELKPI